MNAMLRKGRYEARLATDAADVIAAQRLRHLCFVANGGGVPRASGLDSDRFDARCQHMLIEEVLTGELVGCFRLLPMECGLDIGRSYAGQYYDLSALLAFPDPMVEVGRFCIRPGLNDADVLRVAWGALTRFVDEHRIGMMFGCSSFRGTDAARYAPVFDLLAGENVAPQRWNPKVLAPEVVRFAARPADRKAAMALMPPLLRTYLAMGGWVSDHAVVDRDLNTLHVFTGVEIASIPAARARALRLVAA